MFQAQHTTNWSVSFMSSGIHKWNARIKTWEPLNLVKEHKTKRLMHQFTGWPSKPAVPWASSTTPSTPRCATWKLRAVSNFLLENVTVIAISFFSRLHHDRHPVQMERRPQLRADLVWRFTAGNKGKLGQRDDLAPIFLKDTSLLKMRSTEGLSMIGRWL